MAELPRLSLRDFFVDFLGGLLPGILFTASAVFALTIPIHALLRNTPNRSIVESVIINSHDIAELHNSVWIPLFVFILILSYLAGHLLYRRDPKNPDLASYIILRRKHKREDWGPELGCMNKDACHFPYLHLDQYLRKRGLSHLLPFVLWREEEKKDWRSKNYIRAFSIQS